jgi:hypothetical protein
MRMENGEAWLGGLGSSFAKATADKCWAAGCSPSLVAIALSAFFHGVSLGQTTPAASKVLFEDSMSEGWEENWFLDGKKATVEHRDGGLFFAGGTVTKDDDPEEYHAHHAVLWTKQNFEGDIRISYTMKRVDKSDYGTTLLYIQAQGIGEAPYEKDIHAWSKLREIPDMSLYFKHMDLLSLSFRENLRCKRYPWTDSTGELYPGGGLIEPMRDYSGIIPGETYDVVVEKKGVSLTVHVVNSETGKLVERYTWDTSKIADGIEPRMILKGRIGLRHMATKQFIYRNFRVEKLLTDIQPTRENP